MPLGQTHRPYPHLWVPKPTGHTLKPCMEAIREWWVDRTRGVGADGSHNRGVKQQKTATCWRILCDGSARQKGLGQRRWPGVTTFVLGVGKCASNPFDSLCTLTAMCNSSLIRQLQRVHNE
eukprot:1142442-Pelagomonas_calceolata.AAC.4